MVDHSKTSMWAKLGTEWLTILLYAQTLWAPLCCGQAKTTNGAWSTGCASIRCRTKYVQVFRACFDRSSLVRWCAPPCQATQPFPYTSKPLWG
eukprot:gene9723-biopygen5815